MSEKKRPFNQVWSKYWPYLFVIVPLLLQLIFFFYPVLKGFLYSFTNWSSGIPGDYEFIGLRNYIQAFQDPKFLKSISFTVLFTFIIIAGSIVFGILIARALNHKFRGQSFFRATFFFPAVLSTVTIGMIFSKIFNYGIVGLGHSLHIPFLQENLLMNEKTTVLAVCFVALWQWVAMPVVIILAGLQSIPQEIIEAAEVDGASKWSTFWNIEIPFILPSLSIVFITALKNGITAFDNILVLTAGGPNDKTYSLGLFIYDAAFKKMAYGYGSAIAIILFVIIVILSIIQMKISKKFEI